MHFKRYFLLEPNLKKSYGHVVEFPFALQNYLKKDMKEAYVICNKDIDKGLLSSFHDTYPYITYGCFETLEDEGKMFEKDLSQLDKKFEFKRGDLVISLTSYVSQILGISRFLKRYPINAPTFCIWFHQLYPPTKDFSETLNPEFKSKVYKNLKRAFKALKDFDNVFVFTTPSEGLRETYSEIASHSVHKLPLPYSYPTLKNKRTSRNNLTFGFLGDGRYEKGLLIILEQILKAKDKTNLYLLENIFPRGYSDSELIKLKNLEAKIIGEYANVIFIKEPLSNQEYKGLFEKVEAFLIPYHPQSYNSRVSGVFIEAVINAKPVIASSDTWMAEQIKLLGNGIIFDYKSGTKDLQNSITKLVTNYDSFLQKALKASKQYRNIHSPRNFIKTLLESVN